MRFEIEGGVVAREQWMGGNVLICRRSREVERRGLAADTRGEKKLGGTRRRGERQLRRKRRMEMRKRKEEGGEERIGCGKRGNGERGNENRGNGETG